ncbi:MAG TPA: hypothetical protein EYO33_04670 [Phycisphaerales bacterium]|nr:hypothetical protein [Phycisphaerales bacterium]
MIGDTVLADKIALRRDFPNRGLQTVVHIPKLSMPTRQEIPGGDFYEYRTIPTVDDLFVLLRCRPMAASQRDSEDAEQYQP